MTELLPIEQAFNLRFSLLEYLNTTFNLFEQDTTSALTEFLADGSAGVFRGPFVRMRLPFAPALSEWEQHLEVAPEHPPYGHQAEAFARLSTLVNERPLPTILTTGTGSGKTEAFLLPILDHSLRARRRGESGTKALILYPMNALANDQARRLAELIARDYPGVTAALYTGEASENAQSKMTDTGLITDRAVIRAEAPDILLTNYKMLDQLLLRAEDAPLWERSAESLQYLVMDEFHTYDGAQGTDVAMSTLR